MEGHVPGIDVSYYQGEIDWKRVASAGIKFVIQKATEGASWTDPTLEYNTKGCEENGIKCYLYHFFRPEADIAEQVSNFLFAYYRVKSSAFAWLDVEVLAKGATSGNVTQAAVRWLEDFKARTHNDAGLYTSPNFAGHHLGGLTTGVYPLWIAHVGVARPYLPVQLSVNPHDAWSVWQHSFTGQIPGIKGNVDLNWMKDKFFKA